MTPPAIHDRWKSYNQWIDSGGHDIGLLLLADRRAPGATEEAIAYRRDVRTQVDLIRRLDGAGVLRPAGEIDDRGMSTAGRLLDVVLMSADPEWPADIQQVHDELAKWRLHELREVAKAVLVLAEILNPHLAEATSPRR